MAESFPLGTHFEVCKVEPAHFDGFGRGMRCMQAVMKGQDLMRISLDKCWTVEAARRCPELATLGKDRLDAISDDSLISLHILLVRSQGVGCADACRRDHMALLNSAEFETMLDWPEEDLDFLTGSKWAMVARACRQNIVEEYHSDLLDDLELGDFLQAHEIDESSFLWAHKVLISRSIQFFMEDGSMLYVLGPGHDMFNHSFDVPIGSDEVQLAIDEASGQRSLVVRAFKDYAEGEQAFHSYSGATNGRLLLSAGFVIPGNPCNAVELTFTFPVRPTTLPLYRAVAEGLQTGVRVVGSSVAEETKSEFMETLPPEAEEPTEVVLHMRLSGGEALRGQLERIVAFFRLSRLCGGGAAPTMEQLSLSDRDAACRVLALEQLRDSLRSMLEPYTSTLVDDEAELLALERAANIGDTSTRRREHCVRVLVEEKIIYAQAISFVEELLTAARRP